MKQSFLFLLSLTMAIMTASAFATSSGNNMKRILVTGGNKGIGKAICQRLLEEYDDVHILLGSRDVTRGQAAVDDILRQLGQEDSASSCIKDRLEMVCIDTSSDESVTQAAQQVAASSDQPLYGIINNAGIMQGTLAEVVNVNYFGPQRVVNAFGGQLQRPGGRVVNIASAGGPRFNEALHPNKDYETFQYLTQPWTIPGDEAKNRFDVLDQIARQHETDDKYRFSKALVNAYTVLLARDQPDLIINSVTPGWIKTDMTAGSAASNTPAQGAIPPVWCCMSNELETVPTGRYYGSDCVRSPLDSYRGPGDAPYEGPDGLNIQTESVLLSAATQ